MFHVWIVYLYTLGEKCKHSRGNDGIYSLYGASGIWFIKTMPELHFMGYTNFLDELAFHPSLVKLFMLRNGYM